MGKSQQDHVDWNPYYSRLSQSANAGFEPEVADPDQAPDSSERCLSKKLEQDAEASRNEINYVNQMRPGRILDVGCGAGHFLAGVDDRWEKFGVESSVVAAEQAKEHGKIHVGELNSAGYADDYFDAVVLVRVIEHMRDPEAEILEVMRVLKPGGELIVVTPNFDSACARRFGANFRLLQGPSQVSLFSRDSLERFLWDYGFVVDKVDFPFFETPGFTKENLERLFDRSQISPAFYGDVMSFYCRKPDRSALADSLALCGRLAHRVAVEQEQELDLAHTFLLNAVAGGGVIYVIGETSFEQASRLESGGFRAASWEDASRIPAALSEEDAVLVIGGGDVPAETLQLVAQRRGKLVILTDEVVTLPSDFAASDESDRRVVLTVPTNIDSLASLCFSFVVAALCEAGESVEEEEWADA